VVRGQKAPGFDGKRLNPGKLGKVNLDSISEYLVVRTGEKRALELENLISDSISEF